LEIATIRLKNIKNVVIVEKVREITFTATLHGHQQKISGKFV
jgi:bifunctional DNase/RNase